MNWRILAAMTPVVCAASMAASADMRLRFVESAPKDSFHIENVGACAIGGVELVIDLSTSAGRLVFDVTDAGAGVEVYQPFQLVAGEDRVISAIPVTDGDDMAHLTLREMAPGDKVVFTIDVDDTLTTSELGQIRVTGSEINGASATVITSADGAISANFGRDAQAIISYGDCSS